MSRLNDTIYESDDAHDYLITITHRLEGELAHWLAPEVMTSLDTHYSGWLDRVLTVFELILLLEQHFFNSSVFLIHYEPAEQAVQRWRDVVLHI